MMTVDLSNHVAELLERIGRKEGRKPTEILRRALGLYAYLSTECTGTDNQVAVVDASGKVLKRLKWV